MLISYISMSIIDILVTNASLLGVWFSLHEVLQLPDSNQKLSPGIKHLFEANASFLQV